MKIRTLVTIIAVLGVLSLVAYFVNRPAPPPVADARVGKTLIDQATVEKVTRFRLTDQGKTVTLVRQGDTWRVTSYYDMPVDFTKLSGFVGSLIEAKLERLVTTSAERIARLDFKDSKIELLDDADKALWSVTLGRTADNGGGRYVRFGDEAKAYLASLNAFLDVESKNWASPELLNVKPDDVAKIEIPFADGGPVTVSRAKKEDPWTADKTPENQRLKADKVGAVLSSVGTIRFSDTSAADDPNVVTAKANLRTLKLTTFDNKTYTVALGRKPEEKKPKPAAPAAVEKKPGDDAAKQEAPKENAANPGENNAAAPKPAEPEFETIPAGPVYVFVTASDANAPINALMQKRAFQVGEFVFTSLPQKAEELFEPAPPPAPAPAASTAPAAPATPATPAPSGSEKK